MIQDNNIIPYLHNLKIPEQIEFILSEFYKNFDNKKFNINELCNMLGMRYNDIYDKLISHLNMNPYKILENVRMDFVLTQLLENNISINRLSSKAGYSDPRTFRRAFKRCFGLSAREIKNYLHSNENCQVLFNNYREKIWGRNSP
ncbi:MAG: helix-turn-helix domain-containing protein [Ignavibacteriae bacterium]|nr:helix-turn-helix domain-containing protein [Ignavibacteriota bacterium]